MNPKMVTVDEDEVWAITRIRAARWLGISLVEWDAMTYKDQCIAIEIRRADNEIKQLR